MDPDVVLIDEMMPGLTGLQTALRIRERRPEVPIVLFTANVDAAVARRTAGSASAPTAPHPPGRTGTGGRRR